MLREEMRQFVISLIDMLFIVPYFLPILLIIVVMGVISWAMGNHGETE